MEELRDVPEHYGLFDDLAVSYDRLGDSKVAIEWMGRKREVLDKHPDHPDTKVHRYRYLANLGTFQIHAWIKRGPPKYDVDLAVAARENIGAAIRLNPQAHYGREPYQFMAIDWLVRSREEALPTRSFLERSELFEEKLGDLKLKPVSAPQGIAGLVVLGAAWRSVDVFRNLSIALYRARRSAMGHLAGLRAQELEADGVSSISMAREAFDYSKRVNEQTEKNLAFFVTARREAETWLEACNAYMEAQFAKGKHPDTDADFWDEAVYHGTPPRYDGEVVN